MASILSNRVQVVKALLGLSTAFSLRRRPAGGNKRLGDELIDVATAAIEDRTVNRQQDWAGQPLAPLKARTRERKARLGFDPRILIETHEMLDPEQIRGQTHVTEHEATMRAGLDDETRMKVEAAHEGAPNRRKRPFYDLGPNGEEAVDTLCGEVRDNAVREAERV